MKPKEPLGQYHVGSPLERVHIDILGPFTPESVPGVTSMCL